MAAITEFHQGPAWPFGFDTGLSCLTDNDSNDDTMTLIPTSLSPGDRHRLFQYGTRQPSPNGLRIPSNRHHIQNRSRHVSPAEELSQSSSSPILTPPSTTRGDDDFDMAHNYRAGQSGGSSSGRSPASSDAYIQPDRLHVPPNNFRHQTFVHSSTASSAASPASSSLNVEQGSNATWQAHTLPGHAHSHAHVHAHSLSHPTGNLASASFIISSNFDHVDIASTQFPSFGNMSSPDETQLNMQHTHNQPTTINTLTENYTPLNNWLLGPSPFPSDNSFGFPHPFERDERATVYDHTSRESSFVSSERDRNATSHHSEHTLTTTAIPPAIVTPPAQQTLPGPSRKRSRQGPSPVSGRPSSHITERNIRIRPDHARQSRRSASPASAHADQRRKGGRTDALPEDKRKAASAMRKAIACLPCAVRRDKCPDTNEICQRCERQTAPDSMFKIIGCVRLKLIDLTKNFLPEYMALDYDPRTLRKSIDDYVGTWNDANSREIHFTTGYGPTLPWRLVEFEPLPGLQALGQLQGRMQQGPSPKWAVKRQYSPPFAMKNVDVNDATDRKRVDSYLESLLQQQYLEQCGDSCFGSREEGNQFLASVLQLCGDFYLDSPDRGDDRKFFRPVLRLILLAYIMDHMLTIDESDLPSVLSCIQKSRTPQERLKQISPRLANRQIKSFFSKLRQDAFGYNLNFVDQRFHSSKHEGWFQAFCHMLGLAVVLGQAQEIVQLNLSARVMAKLVTYDEARRDAERSCEEIDENFKFLLKLFYTKYRPRKQTHGPFGNNTPDYQHPTWVDFLHGIRGLVFRNVDLLRNAKGLTISAENGSQLPLRMLAHFFSIFDDFRAVLEHPNDWHPLSGTF